VTILTRHIFVDIDIQRALKNVATL